MISAIKQLGYCFHEWRRVKKITCSTEYDKEQQRSRIIRLTHSIEKGLCLEAPRPGFGVAKLEQLFAESEAYKKKYGSNEFCLNMVIDAVSDYIRFHDSKQYSDESIDNLKDKLARLREGVPQRNVKAGGFQHISVHNDCSQLTDYFLSRHSVREFDDTPVNNQDIIEAVEIAQLCPSACNRQAYRAYVIKARKLVELYHKKLSGIGGFAESADRFILITGKLSAYDFSEYNQYIVSASIFATYLSLSLLDKNIGSCIVQRPLRDSKQNRSIMAYCQIPGDEQIVVMMAVGNLKQEFNVPISKRFPVGEILRFVE